MKGSLIRVLLSLLAVAVFTQSQRPNPPPGFNSANHVIIIGIDGFGAHYMYNYTDNLPYISYLMNHGTHATQMRCRNPSISAPNWATIVTGMVPEESGVIDNDWVNATSTDPDLTTIGLPPITGKGKIPITMWNAAKKVKKDIKTAVAYSWDWFVELMENESVDWYFRGHEDDNTTADALAEQILKEKPNLMFIHFDGVDEAGHGTCWGCPEYYKAAREQDFNIGKLMNATLQAGIFNQTLFIVTADHGGYQSSHGSFNQICMQVPAIFHGPMIQKNAVIDHFTSNADFAPTALWSLGIRPPFHMNGRILFDIFQKPFPSDNDNIYNEFYTFVESKLWL